MPAVARACCLSLSLLLAAGAVCAQAAPPAAAATAAASLVAEAGCLNCHGTPPRGDAGRLQPASRYAERFADPEAVKRFVAQLRADTRIVGHRQLTEAQGRQIADWLAKPAPAQPVR